MFLNYSGYIHSCSKLVKRAFQEGKWNIEVIAAFLCDLSLFFLLIQNVTVKKKERENVIFTYLFVLALYWTSNKLLWRENIWKYLNAWSIAMTEIRLVTGNCVLIVSLKHFVRAWQLQNLLLLSSPLIWHPEVIRLSYKW